MSTVGGMGASLAVPVEGGRLTCFMITPAPDSADGLGGERHRQAVVIGIHGGPSPALDEDAAHRDAAPWVEAGFAYFAVDFRASGVLGPEQRAKALSGADVPGAGADAHDVSAAIAALSESQLAHRVDLDRSILYGYSYGAYVLNRWVTNDVIPESIRLAVCHEGVADLRRMDRASMQIQIERRGCTPEACPEHWAAASPIERAERVEVPMLLVYGAESPSYAQGAAWRDALHAQGSENFWQVLPGEGHVFSPEAMSQLVRHVSALADRIGSTGRTSGTRRGAKS